MMIRINRYLVFPVLQAFIGLSVLVFSVVSDAKTIFEDIAPLPSSGISYQRVPSATNAVQEYFKQFPKKIWIGQSRKEDEIVYQEGV